jgi:hypothetical protein
MICMLTERNPRLASHSNYEHSQIIDPKVIIVKAVGFV